MKSFAPAAAFMVASVVFGIGIETGIKALVVAALAAMAAIAVLTLKYAKGHESAR